MPKLDDGSFHGCSHVSIHGITEVSSADLQSGATDRNKHVMVLHLNNELITTSFFVEREAAHDVAGMLHDLASDLEHFGTVLHSRSS